MATRHNKSSPHPRPVPRFYVWHRELLYLATTPSQPTPHRLAHDRLMVSLSGDFGITLDGRSIRTRSCLLTTGQWHDPATIDTSDAVTATWLLAPFSQDAPALARVMQRAGSGLYYDHPQEDALINALLEARRTSNTEGESVRPELRQLLLPSEVRAQVFRVFDPRVIEVGRRVWQTINLNLPIDHYASGVDLSGSYLEKLFKEHTGVPITQFRLGYRTYVSAILLGMGYSITDAALKAGFSSSSHFSRTHRALTGETASKLFIRSGTETIIERKALRSALQVVRAGKTTGAPPEPEPS